MRVHQVKTRIDISCLGENFLQHISEKAGCFLRKRVGEKAYPSILVLETLTGDIWLKGFSQMGSKSQTDCQITESHGC